MISAQAVQILKSAIDGDGRIAMSKTSHGFNLSTKAKVFADHLKDDREEAMLKGDIEELEKAGLIDAVTSKREGFKVTQSGYEYGNDLSE